MRRIIYFLFSVATLISFALFILFGLCVLENKAFTQTPQKLTIEVKTINKIGKYNLVVGKVKDLGDLVEVVETTSTTEESTDENSTEQTTEQTTQQQKKKMGEDEVTVTQSPKNVGKTCIYIRTDEDLKYFCFNLPIEVGKDYVVVTTTQHNINCSPSMQKTMIILTIIALVLPLLWFFFGSNLKEKKVQLF